MGKKSIIDERKIAAAADHFLRTITEAKLRNWDGKHVDALESIRRREHPLKARLKKAGVSQSEAGIYLGGIHQPNINSWLNGTFDMPPIVEEKLEMLCEVVERRNKEGKR